MSRDTSRAGFLGWSTFLLSLACLGILGWYIPDDRRLYLMMFKDFRVELPIATRLILSIPGVAFPVTAIIVGIIAIAVQFFGVAKGRLLWFPVLLSVACLITLVAYREAMIHPLMALIRSISTPAIR
jgi:hypothetical protein